jgi:hypothetical protein
VLLGRVANRTVLAYESKIAATLCSPSVEVTSWFRAARKRSHLLPPLAPVSPARGCFPLRFARRLQVHKGLKPFTVFTLSINFIIGIGVLDLPYIFYSAGLVTCTAVVIMSALVSQLAVHYVMEAQARAVAWTRVRVLAAQTWWRKLGGRGAQW